MNPELNTPPSTNQPDAPQSIAPTPTPPIPSPVMSPEPAYTAIPKKSKKPWIIIATVIVTLIIILIAAYMLFFSPAVLANKSSVEFMNAATSADVDKLVKIDGEDEESRDFLEDVAESLKGSYELKEKKSKDGKWYFLYTLEDAKSKYARTIVEKKDGKWVVTSIVYGDDELSVIPSESTDKDEETETEENAAESQDSEQTAPSTAMTCLLQDDYKYMNYDKQPSSVVYDETFDREAYTFNHTDSMFFEADSIAETSFASTYDDWADFAKQASSKQWTFRLSGTTYDNGNDSSADPTSVKLASDRVNEVKRELVSRGVPESRIIIDEPINNSDEYQEGFDAKIFRRVEILIDPTCSATSSSDR